MNLSDYGMNGLSWSSLMFANVLPNEASNPALTDKERSKQKLHIPVGSIWVIEPERTDALYKIPGGGREDIDPTPKETAIREFYEEVNIVVSPDRVTYVGKWLGRRGDHYKLIFRCEIYEFEIGSMSSHAEGNEGEIPICLPKSRLDELVLGRKVLREHFDKLVEFGLLIDTSSRMSA